MYFSRPTGQAFFQNASASPFALVRIAIGGTNKDATFQMPFAQPFPARGLFLSFRHTLSHRPQTSTLVPPNFRSSLIQQFGLNLQGELAKDMLLEIGYVGSRGTHLQRVRSLNQALHASRDNPIRDAISDTVANISSRVPILGIPADSLDMVESEGSSWYNGLELSLTKQMSHGLQFLASYTFSKTLDTDGANINGTLAGIALTLGDQNSPSQRWGRASFDRTQRFADAGAFLRALRGVPLIQKALMAAVVVLVLAAGGLWYRNYLDSLPQPWDQLQPQTRQEFDAKIKAGDEVLEHIKHGGNLAYVQDAAKSFGEAYRLHPRDPEAVRGLKAAANYAIDWFGKFPDKKEALQQLQGFQEWSNYYKTYPPMQRAIRAAGGDGNE